MPCAVIFANGLIPDLAAIRRLIAAADALIAADGGTRHLLALGLVPAVLIGDLDSVTQPDLHRLEAAGTDIRRHPRDKNETDLELALQYAVEIGCREILIAGALGGRLDQSLANLSLLSAEKFAGLDVRADDGVEEAFFVRSHARVRGSPGEVVSLIPWGREVNGVTTEGLRWPLQDETLYSDRTRGISNELVEESASVFLKSGLLLLVHLRKTNS